MGNGKSVSVTASAQFPFGLIKWWLDFGAGRKRRHALECEDCLAVEENKDGFSIIKGFMRVHGSAPYDDIRPTRA